jgi:hypothetical protein
MTKRPLEPEDEPEATFVGEGSSCAAYRVGTKLYRVQIAGRSYEDVDTELVIQNAVQNALKKTTPWKVAAKFTAYRLSTDYDDIPKWAKPMWNKSSEKCAKGFLSTTLVVPFIEMHPVYGDILINAEAGWINTACLEELKSSIFDALLLRKHLGNKIPGFSHNDYTPSNMLVARVQDQVPFFVDLDDGRSISINPKTHPAILTHAFDMSLAQTDGHTHLVVGENVCVFPFLGITGKPNPKYDYTLFLARIKRGINQSMSRNYYNYNSKLWQWSREFLAMMNRHFKSGYSNSVYHPYNEDGDFGTRKLIDGRLSGYIPRMNELAKKDPDTYSKYLESGDFFPVCNAFYNTSIVNEYPLVAAAFGITDSAKGPFDALYHCPPDDQISPLDNILLDPFFSSICIVSEPPQSKT